MTQYNTLNIMVYSQLNKLKSAIKNGTEVTLNLSSNLIGSSNHETNFPYKLLLTDTQVSKIRKTFANGSSANIKFSKTELPKIEQSGGFIFPVPIWGSSEPQLNETLSSAISLANSYEKELKNTGATKLDENTFVDAGLSLLGKKITKGISSITFLGITLRNRYCKRYCKSS